MNNKVIKNIILIDDFNKIKYVNNVKETPKSLLTKLKNNNKYNSSYKLSFNLDYIKNKEQINNKELFKKEFINILNNTINKNSQKIIKKEELENKIEEIFTGNNIIVNFVELFFIASFNLSILFSNAFLNKLKNKIEEDIQLQLPPQILNLNKLNKDILIKKLQSQSNININNNEIEELKKLLNYLKQNQKKLIAEIKKYKKEIEYYKFNINANYINNVKYNNKLNNKLNMQLKPTPAPKYTHKLKLG